MPDAIFSYSDIDIDARVHAVIDKHQISDSPSHRLHVEVDLRESDRLVALKEHLLDCYPNLHILAPSLVVEGASYHEDMRDGHAQSLVVWDEEGETKRLHTAVTHSHDFFHEKREPLEPMSIKIQQPWPLGFLDGLRRDKTLVTEAFIAPFMERAMQFRHQDPSAGFPAFDDLWNHPQAHEDLIDEQYGQLPIMLMEYAAKKWESHARVGHFPIQRIPPDIYESMRINMMIYTLTKNPTMDVAQWCSGMGRADASS